MLPSLDSLWTEPSGSGLPVLWLHGLGESSLCFSSIRRHPRLRGAAHQLIDLPGYGRSPRPATAYGLEELASALAALLAAQRPAVIVGHSMGGVVAQLVAERAPAAVRAVVNIEGNLSLGDCVFSGRAAAVELPEFVETGHQELCDWVYQQGQDSPALRGYYASMRFADARVFHRHSRDLLEVSRHEDLARRAAALPVPSLYLAGVPDGICAHSKHLLEAAGARWLAVEPAGHWPFIDQAEVVARAISDWLDSTLGAAWAER
jgi:pimeloyl-ACP methyl ester carboxylesterase